MGKASVLTGALLLAGGGLCLSGCDEATASALQVPAAARASAPVQVVEADMGRATTIVPAAVKVVEMAPDECPEGMALVADRFCIDRYEASLVSAEGEDVSPYHPVKARSVRAVSAQGAIPQGYINQEQASAACERAGKRLCSTVEWLDACMGEPPRPRTYPYGNEEKAGACNTDRVGHPTMELHNGRRKTDSYWLNDPRINQLGSTVAPSGAYAECRTPEGVHDMHGNLLEWTLSGKRPLLMGGHYLDGKGNGRGCRYVTLLHGSEYHDFTTGFRCCADRLGEEKQSVSASTLPDDVPKHRSFSNAAAKLPPMAPAAGYANGAACPTDMTLVEGDRCLQPQQECMYWVDDPGKPKRSCGRFEAARCAAGTEPMRYCIDTHEYTPPGARLPLVNVSWGEAQLMCKKQDKRLCLEAEWEFACEGEAPLPYPYGYERDGERCNHDRTQLFDKRGKLNDQRVEAKALTQCKSPFGVYNLVGNVDEWTTRGGKRRSILRGGWWLKGRNRCRAATSSHGETYAGSQTGFRCCKAAR